MIDEVIESLEGKEIGPSKSIICGVVTLPMNAAEQCMFLKGVISSHIAQTCMRYKNEFDIFSRYLEGFLVKEEDVCLTYYLNYDWRNPEVSGHCPNLSILI